MQALADLATIAIIQERAIRQAEFLTEQLQFALNSRIVIEQAKGAVARSLGVTVEVAFQTMRRHARRERMGLTDLAMAIVETPEGPQLLRLELLRSVDLVTSAELPIAAALPAMQTLASRIWSPEARHHPGQLAWGYAYGLPEVLGHGPAVVVDARRGGGGLGLGRGRRLDGAVRRPGRPRGGG